MTADKVVEKWVKVSEKVRASSDKRKEEVKRLQPQGLRGR